MIPKKILDMLHSPDKEIQQLGLSIVQLEYPDQIIISYGHKVSGWMAEDKKGYYGYRWYQYKYQAIQYGVRGKGDLYKKTQIESFCKIESL